MACKHNIRAALVYIYRLTYFFQLIHSGINHPKDMGGIIDRLHTAEDRERKHTEHQHNGKFHLPV